MDQLCGCSMNNGTIRVQRFIEFQRCMMYRVSYAIWFSMEETLLLVRADHFSFWSHQAHLNSQSNGKHPSPDMIE